MDRPVRREFKNSVFIDLFGQDKYRLQLFQTLHPEMPEVTAADITTLTLKQVVTEHQYNDMAFLVNDRLMVFVEAQSTWSVNILIRILLYLADTIQEYLQTKSIDIHRSRKIDLPKPEFYVIYTGKDAAPEVISLRETFFEGAEDTVDLRAKVITAETTDIIGQYIIFCRVLDDRVKLLGPTRQAAEEAIRICQDRGVLADYLEDRKKEVMDIMIMLFDQEFAVQQTLKAQRKEGRLEGRKEGRLEGALKTLFGLVRDGLLTVNIAAKRANMPEEEFLSLMNKPETEEDAEPEAEDDAD